jgi:hypothetical protein
MLSLADAIIQEDTDQIREILQQGINLNQIDEYGFTPLIEAAIVNNVRIARALIEYGADVNLKDSIGGTPLHWAAENNNIELCELLLIQGADPNAYNLTGQPVLVMPFLRQQQPLKKLLISAGANLDFAQDFINTKSLGHLFELIGTADIIDPRNEFVEVDFEGFFLEVTLGMITESLAQYQSHFAGRQVRRYNQFTEVTIQVLNRATQLIKYQQYQVNLKKHEKEVNYLIQQEPVIIPIGYEGHAITFIKFGHILVKCDRREDSRLYDNVVFYQVNRPDLLTTDFIKNLVYEQQTFEFINQTLQDMLQLQPITEIKIAAQISGNCSWANVEACIPVLFFLLFSTASDFQSHIARYKNLALDFFHQWREWNKDRSLNFCIQSFNESDSIRKACKAELLTAILFQCCNDNSPKNKERAETIISTLISSNYTYVLQNYVKSYFYEDISEEGKNFARLLKSYGMEI